MVTVNRSTALGLSAIVHVTLFCAGLIAWPWAGRTQMVEVTPVTLMTSQEVAELSRAEYAETPPQQALTETPEDAAPEVPAEPEPEPAPPAPPAAPPKAAEAPRTPSPRPTPARPPTPQARPDTSSRTSMNLDNLAESLAKSNNTNTRSAAAEGPSQFETDLARRLSDGQARAASNDALSRIASRLERLWNICTVSGAETVQFRVRFSLNPDGSLAGQAQLLDYRDITAIANPVARLAAERALAAVAQASPYDGLPREDYAHWKTVTVNFDARSACT